MKLTVRLSGKVVSSHEFEDNPKVVIGRSSTSDVVIENVGVSRAHCEIVRDGRAWVLQDLHSNNGTYVNGKRVWSHNLNDGDEIALGKFKVSFEDAQVAPEQPLPPPSSGGKKLDGEFTMGIEGIRPEMFRAAAGKPKGYIAVTGARGRDATVPLEKTVVVIGKGDMADIRVSGFFVGRKHALIVRDDVGFLVVDTSGKYRTYVNDSPIDADRLRDGDVIRIANHEFRFKVGSPDY